jgi:hypothetical protein
VDLAGRVGIERDETSVDQQPSDPVERRLGPAAIGNVLEEREDAAHVVRARVVERVDPRPEQLRRPVEPRVLHAASVQRAGDRPRRDQRRGQALLGLPPRRVRPAADAGQYERGPAPLGRGALQPVAGACDQLLVPGVGLVERTQRELDGGGLAGRRAAVGLERVPEPAVVVAVRGDRVADGTTLAVREEALEPTAVEHTGARCEEALRCREIGNQHGGIRAQGPRPVLNETAMSAGYHEFAPPAALRSALACLWVRVVAQEGPPTRVLPDACVDLIWESGRGAFVAGPDTGPTVVPVSPESSSMCCGPS